MGSSRMRSFSGARGVLAPTAVGLRGIVAACSSPPPPPPPVVQAPPPPPPITLSAQVIERASAFRGYMARAGAVSPTFQNGDQIQTSLKIGAAYEPKSFMNGAVAYAVVLALPDPPFLPSRPPPAAPPPRRRGARAPPPPPPGRGDNQQPPPHPAGRGGVQGRGQRGGP